MQTIAFHPQRFFCSGCSFARFVYSMGVCENVRFPCVVFPHSSHKWLLPQLNKFRWPTSWTTHKCQCSQQRNFIMFISSEFTSHLPKKKFDSQQKNCGKEFSSFQPKMMIIVGILTVCRVHNKHNIIDIIQIAHTLGWLSVRLEIQFFS